MTDQPRELSPAKIADIAKKLAHIAAAADIHPTPILMQLDLSTATFDLGGKNDEVWLDIVQKINVGTSLKAGSGSKAVASLVNAVATFVPGNDDLTRLALQLGGALNGISSDKMEFANQKYDNDHNNINVELLDVTTIAPGFPSIPKTEVLRDNLLDVLEKMLQDDCQTVFIEGEPGLGKTSLLSQYARRHRLNSIALFFKPGSQLAYSTQYLRAVLWSQWCWLYNEVIKDDEIPDEVEYRLLITRLHRKIERKKRKIHIIIDGLENVLEEDIEFVQNSLVNLLPIGLTYFAFLITGDPKRLNLIVKRSGVIKSHYVPALSLEETKIFLKDLKVEEDVCHEVHKVCRGIPGNLEALKRLIISGKSIDEILQTDKLEFFELEWQTFSYLPLTSKVLPLLVFGKRGFTIDEISGLLDLSPEDIKDYIEKVTIFNYDSKDNLIQLISESHRKYVAKKLSNYKEKTINTLIDAALKDKSSDVAFELLPMYYHQVDRHAELLTFLSPEYFGEVIQKQRSLGPIYHHVELGLSSAKIIHKFESIFSFNLCKSFISGLDRTSLFRAEIEARISVGDVSLLQEIANRPFLAEDKLHLYTIIEKARIQGKLSVEENLEAEIRTIFSQVDPKSLGRRAVEIASDLMIVDPELAVMLIEKASGDTRGLDEAFLHLSVMATAENDKQNVPNILQTTQNKISNLQIKAFSDAMSVLFGTCNAEEAIKRVEKLDPHNRFFVLREWTEENYTREDADKVIDYCLDQLIAQTSQTPNLKRLRQIATPLPYLKNLDRRKELIRRFDSQKGSMRHLSTSEDYVRLQLKIARAEYQVSSEQATGRVLETYWDIANLEDLSTKTECLAWLISELPKIDQDGELERREGLHEVAKAELTENLDLLDLFANSGS